MPFWGIRPAEEQPEKKKAIAPYAQTPPLGKSERKFYLLSQPTIILTPAGYVEARAGDVIEARDTGLWVLAAEILRAWGAEIKPLKEGT